MQKAACRIVIVLTLSWRTSAAQAPAGSLKFSFLFNGLPLRADSLYRAGNDSFQVSCLKLYISSLQLLDAAQESIYREAASYHLLDVTDTGSCRLVLPAEMMQPGGRLCFCLGIDSATNVSGAIGGDLDPTKGMYWTWQSGYINLKLEGWSTRCRNRKREFQFHLGGYAAPFDALQCVSVPLNATSLQEIQVDVYEILQQIDLAVEPSILSPGATAVKLAEIIARQFQP